jgi:hypothetical protein
MSEIDEQLKQKLLSYLDGIESRVNEAGSLLQAEVPVYCQEYISWYFWSSLFGFAACLFFIAVIVSIAVWFLRRAIIRNEPDEALLPTLALIFATVMVWPAVINASALIKATTAPRVVIVDHLKEVLRK